MLGFADVYFPRACFPPALGVYINSFASVVQYNCNKCDGILVLIVIRKLVRACNDQ